MGPTVHLCVVHEEQSRAERQIPGELPWGSLAMGLCTENSVIVKQEEAQP